MSHGDSLEKIAPGFSLVGESEHKLPAVGFNSEKNIYGLQFHPEVTHCEYGIKILENFVCTICQAKKEWSMDRYIEEEGRTDTQKGG
jgi:GMP synthase (glutamine-hydrolysing)